MGACSIKGGNVGGIPDRQQRSRPCRRCPSIYVINIIHPDYFDPSEEAEAKPMQVETQGSTDSENSMGVEK